MKTKFWIIGYAVIIIVSLSLIAEKIIEVDPFFHYHKPDTVSYFYKINNQRSQNDGITRNFDYDGLITGTSMIENFKTSEAENIFGGKFVKVPYSGGSYKEINQNLQSAAKHNANLKIIIRGLDYGKIFDNKDYMRMDLGKYPAYLYDDFLLNDVEYIFNRDVIFSRVYPMEKENDAPDFKGGITSFDRYSNWMSSFKFGPEILIKDKLENTLKMNIPEKISQKVIDGIRENISQNVTSLASEYPDITFYYFFTPYSAMWWECCLEEGKFDNQIQAERIVIEEILKYDNIRLFSFNCLFDITTDLNNYKDSLHYGEWINSLILRYMHDGYCQLTLDNYEKYLEEEYQFYSNFDYTVFMEQEDYDNDYYAAVLVNSEITGTKPLVISYDDEDSVTLSHAVIEENLYNGKPGVICTGTLQRKSSSDVSVSDYIKDVDFIGLKISVNDITPYKYLVFDGKKIQNHGQFVLLIYDSEENLLLSHSEWYKTVPAEWHHYFFDLGDFQGPITIFLNGGYVDDSGSPESKFAFSNIVLY